MPKNTRKPSSRKAKKAVRAKPKGHLAVAEVLSIPFRVVVETIHVWSYLMQEIKITPPISALLTAIRSKEAPNGYDDVFGGIKSKNRIKVTEKTVGEVLLWQANIRKNKLAKSTAAGGYQFIYLTLAATVKGMGIPLESRFDEDLQDRMAVYLMQKRGLSEYLDGKITAEQFANNLAKEWASLPVVTKIKGPNKRALLEPGESYYDGDKLNAAHHDPGKILALVRSIKAPAVDIKTASVDIKTPQKPVSVPEPPNVAQEEVKPPVASPAPVKVSWLGKLFGWGAS